MYRLDVDEYYDIAALGLCKAAISYIEDKGISFATYAYKCMYNEIGHEYRKNKKYVLIEDIEELESLHSLTNKISKEDVLLDDMELESFINTIPKEKHKRIAVLLSKGYNNTEIGKILNISSYGIGLMKLDLMRYWFRFKNQSLLDNIPLDYYKQKIGKGGV